MLLLNFVEINLVSPESRGWPTTFLSKLDTRKGSNKVSFHSFLVGRS